MNYCRLVENCTVWDRRLKLPGICYSSPLCEGCHVRTISHLRMLRLDYVDLSQALVPSGGANQVRIARPKPGSRPPLDFQMLTMRDDVARVVLLADAGVRARWGQAPIAGAGMREGAALDHAVRHLEERVELLAGLEGVQGCWEGSEAVSVALSGPQVVLLLGDTHRRARRLLGLAPATIAVPGHCPACGAALLRRHDDDDTRIWCQACKNGMDRSAYIKAVMLQIRP